jgi:hypothetical protein
MINNSKKKIQAIAYLFPRSYIRRSKTLLRIKLWRAKGGEENGCQDRQDYSLL